ncbi:MAG: hypothetical protein B7Z55_01395, partial [Planctomycetales bacterium 12-60-4]
MATHPVLIGGQWRPSRGGDDGFSAVNPATGETLPERYPISPAEELEECLKQAASAAQAVRCWPGERFAEFLDCFAEKIEGRAADLIAMAHQETGLPITPRLKDAELPRTINQLRQAAAAARDGSWANPTIDIDLEDRESPAIGAAIAAGDADIGIGSQAASVPGLESHPFRIDRLVLAVPTGHQLAGKRQTGFADLLDLDFVGLPRGTALDEHLAMQAARL